MHAGQMKKQENGNQSTWELN